MDTQHRTRLDFLIGGGEMGAAIRAKDWTETSVGPPDTWPAELRIVIRLMLTTNHPMYIFWGPELACFYNDAYSHSIGPERHPASLGAPGREVWDEIWDIIGPQIELVMTGKGATWHQDQLVPITRHAKREDVYWTYSYSPIDDPSAPYGVGGVLVICNETTERIRTEQTLERELKTKEFLLGEVNHRIKNSLQLVSSLLHLESSAAGSEEVRAILQRASARVQAVSSIHELIYQSDNIATVSFGRYLNELCGAIRFSAVGRDSQLSIECSTGEIELRTDLAITVALLINELVTNSLKHAFPHGRSGIIRVASSVLDGSLKLRVTDDGVGLAASDGEPGVGSKIIEGLVAQVDGKMTKGGGKSGHTVEIEIPLPSSDR